MSLSPKPEIVLVQGSFQKPHVYQKIYHELKRLGYSVTQPLLPSCHDPDRADCPNTTMTDDANAVRDEISRLLDRGRTVFVVCHSYGGIVANEAISEDMTFTMRNQRGQKGGVLHLFMFAAFVLPLGQSVLDAFGESPNNDVMPDGRFIIKNAKQTLYADLSPSEADSYASELIPQSYRVQQTKATRAAHIYLPSTYLICDNDQACPPNYQEMFAGQTNSAVEHCSTGHSPMLVDPEMLASKINVTVVKAVAAVD